MGSPVNSDIRTWPWETVEGQLVPSSDDLISTKSPYTDVYYALDQKTGEWWRYTPHDNVIEHIGVDSLLQVAVDSFAKPVMSVDPDTGAKKQSKLARHDLIPPKAWQEVAERFGIGVLNGYEANNWRGGYDWGLSYAALCRHLAAFWSGEDFDPEVPEGTKAKHIIAVAWHALVLSTFMDEHPEKDTRFKPKKEEG